MFFFGVDGLFARAAACGRAGRHLTDLAVTPFKLGWVDRHSIEPKEALLHYQASLGIWYRLEKEGKLKHEPNAVPLRRSLIEEIVSCVRRYLPKFWSL